jgi:hypothetical protein
MRDGILEALMEVAQNSGKKEAGHPMFTSAFSLSTRTFGAKEASAVQIQTSRLPQNNQYCRITNNQVNVDRPHKLNSTLDI